VAIRVYRHTDASAPVLTGQVGSMSALLKACLVTGYGSKTAAGWGNPFSGAAGQEVFRPGSGVRHYFAHDDAGPGAGTFKEARIFGWETMTAWATGTGQFPLTGVSASGVVDLKSSTADATARPWVVIADDRTCYAFADFSHTTAQYLAGTIPNYSGVCFGEIYSALTVADLFRSIVIGRNIENSTSAINDPLPWIVSAVTGLTQTGHYMPRTITGLGVAIAAKKWGDWTRANGAAQTWVGLGVSGMAVPDPATGAIHLAPVHVSDDVGLRGRMRGLFQLCHAQTPFADGDTIVGSGAYAGRTFLVVKGVQGGSTTAGASNSQCALVFDITGAWETN
jgi:hypothetical protein